MQDAIFVMHKLQIGQDVNVRFTGRVLPYFPKIFSTVIYPKDSAALLPFII